MATIKSNEGVLETRIGTEHVHVDECGQFTVTRLVSDVVYTLKEIVSQFNGSFKQWTVTGKDAKGISHSFSVKHYELSGSSRFSGYF